MFSKYSIRRLWTSKLCNYSIYRKHNHLYCLKKLHKKTNIHWHTDLTIVTAENDRINCLKYIRKYGKCQLRRINIKKTNMYYRNVKICCRSMQKLFWNTSKFDPINGKHHLALLYLYFY